MDAKLEQKALLPCPFCGNTKPEFYSANSDHGEVNCADCGASVFSRSPIDARNAWNTRALQAQPAEGGVGFVLVPVEPTEAMRAAGNRVGEWGFHESSLTFRGAGNPGEIYAAMLAAAPKPATTTGEGVGS